MRTWRVVLGVGLLALAVRAPALGRSLWLDEAVSWHMAALEPAQLLVDVVREDTHPPGWYMALRGWLEPGSSDLVARLLPLLLGLAHVAVLALIARRLLGPAGALAAALLAAVVPEMVWPSYELRSFAMAALLSSVGWLCVLVALEHGGWWRWALGALALSGSLWTFYYAALAGPALAAFVLLRRPPASRLVGFALCGLVAALSLVPWLPRLGEQLGRVRVASVGGSHEIVLTLHGLLYDWLYQHLVRLTPWHVASAAALAVAFLWALRRRPGPLLAPPAESPRAQAALVPLAGLVGAFVLGVLVFSRLGGFVHRKYGGFLAGAWCVLGAALWLRLHPRLRPLALGAVLLASAGESLVSALRAERAPWRQTVQWLERRRSPDEPVTVVPSWESAPLDRYLGPGRKALGLPWDLAARPHDEPFRVDRVPLYAERLERFLARQDSLWFVLAGREGTDRVDAPRALLLEGLERHGFRRDVEHAVKRLRLEHWTR